MIKKVITMRDDIPNIAEIIASRSRQDTILQESAADLGAIIVEMEREENYYRKHTRRLAELKRIAALQEIVVRRLLDRSIEKPGQPKGPHLTVVE